MKFEDRHIIMKGIFGSHLYGLSTPESDKDYKGIFLPTKRELYLGECPESLNFDTSDDETKNTPDDVDTEYYSLNYFIELALKGETAAIDMLHCPISGLEEFSPHLWFELQGMRTKFYSKSMKSFVGYARKQAVKYSIKGKRLEFLDDSIKFLSEYHPTIKMDVAWSLLPVGEYAYFKEKDGEEWWWICERRFNKTTPISIVLDSLVKIRKGYGKRAEEAKNNGAVDWKAMSHAFRACYQQKDIFIFGDYEYPLVESDMIMKVKQGKLDFLTEVMPELEKLLIEVEEASETSALPDRPDHKFWNDWLFDILNIYITTTYKE